MDYDRTCSFEHSEGIYVEGICSDLKFLFILQQPTLQKLTILAWTNLLDELHK